MTGHFGRRPTPAPAPERPTGEFGRDEVPWRVCVAQQEACLIHLVVSIPEGL